MVELSSFRRDARAMRDGEWVSPWPDAPEFRIQTRARGAEYEDVVGAKIKKLVRKHGSEDGIPAAERRRAVTEALIEKCLQNVEGLTEGGQPVPFERFCELLFDEGAGDLADAAFNASSRVGRQRADDIKAAAGN